MNGLPKIEAIYAWVVRDGDNTEGIPAVMLGGHYYPAVGYNLATMEKLDGPIKAYLERDGKGATAELVKFSNREKVRDLKP